MTKIWLKFLKFSFCLRYFQPLRCFIPTSKNSVILFSSDVLNIITDLLNGINCKKELEEKHNSSRDIVFLKYYNDFLI